MFDSGKKGSIEKEKVRTILNTLGQSYDDTELETLLKGEDPQGNKTNEILTPPTMRLRFMFDVVVMCVHWFYYNARATLWHWSKQKKKKDESMISI